MAAAPVLAALLLFAAGAIPAWTTYRHDAARSGIDPESTSPLPPSQAWQTAALDGSIYTEPLVYGSQVYVATEHDTIYSLDAATGAVAWETHLGTPVPRSRLPCGDIEPTVGITGTPAIDPATDTIYAVTDTWDGTHPESIRHMLVALELGTGAMRPGFPIAVDPPFPAGGSAAEQLQRAALALDGEEVVIGYGGNDGDCATYWGWLVGAPASGSGPLRSYQVDSKPGDEEGAIWGAGNGPPEEANGDLYAATGNGTSGSTFDYGDSVLKLDPGLELLESWAPADWQELDEHDLDLGSSDPVLLPDELAFEIGKQGVGVLLHTDALGGVGAAPAAELAVCDGSWGGGIYVPASATAGTLYVTCRDGLNAVAVSGVGGAEPKLSQAANWKVNNAAVGPPIFAGGLVWVASYEGKPGYLYGLDPSTGAVEFERDLGSFEHFSTPGAGGGRLFAANANKVTAFTIAATPAPPPTTTPAPSPTTTSASLPLRQVFPGGAPPVLRTAVRDLRQSHVLWREGKRSIARAGSRTTRPPVGTTFSFSLDRQARVTFRFARLVSGRRVGRTCLALTSSNRRHRRCERTPLAGTFAFAGRPGTNKVAFQGRLPHAHKLAPGRYELTVTATSATGTSAPKSLVFTIV